MRYFPLFLDLEGRRVVVVGGGEEAVCKIRLLLKTNARIEMVADGLPEELQGNSKISLIPAPYRPDMIVGAVMVLSADALLNEQVSADAQRLSIPVNAVDDAALSTFIVPSIVDRDPVVIAIGTEGTAPVLGQNIRAKIDAMLPKTIGALARRAASLRQWVATRVPHGTTRRAFWADFFSGKNDVAYDLQDEVAQKLALDDAVYFHGKARAGRVSLVGVGPGDPELLTLKAHRRLMEADVIVYDGSILPAVLEMARRDATRVAVAAQDDINLLLVREAAAGRDVVCLKIGDLSTSGRSNDEQAYLTKHNIAFDVVPGVAVHPGSGAVVNFPARAEAREAILRVV